MVRNTQIRLLHVKLSYHERMEQKRLCIEYDCTNERIPGQRVCKSCHAAYMRDHRRMSREKLVNRARFEGIEAVVMKLKEMGHADIAALVARPSSYTFHGKNERAA